MCLFLSFQGIELCLESGMGGGCDEIQSRGVGVASHRLSACFAGGHPARPLELLQVHIEALLFDEISDDVVNIDLVCVIDLHRLENEHLNNVGKYRAVKTVPLPFSGMDSDG